MVFKLLYRLYFNFNFFFTLLHHYPSINFFLRTYTKIIHLHNSHICILYTICNIWVCIGYYRGIHTSLTRVVDLVYLCNYILLPTVLTECMCVSLYLCVRALGNPINKQPKNAFPSPDSPRGEAMRTHRYPLYCGFVPLLNPWT